MTASAAPVLSDLHLLTVLAQTRSYTQAARRLGISKASVSMRIAELERATGVPLVRRTTRSVGLTEAGQQLVDDTQGAFTRIEQSFASIKDLAGTPRGLVRVTAPVALGRQHVAPTLAAFLRSYPEIRLELDLTDRLRQPGAGRLRPRHPARPCAARYPRGLGAVPEPLAAGREQRLPAPARHALASDRTGLASMPAVPARHGGSKLGVRARGRAQGRGKRDRGGQWAPARQQQRSAARSRAGRRGDRPAARLQRGGPPGAAPAGARAAAVAAARLLRRAAVRDTALVAPGAARGAVLRRSPAPDLGAGLCDRIRGPSSPEPVPASTAGSVPCPCPTGSLRSEAMPPPSSARVHRKFRAWMPGTS